MAHVHKPEKISQPSKRPTRKIEAATLAGSVTTLALFIASQFGVELPGEVAASITTILTVLTGYIAKDRS